jgi:hypothetical protein
MRVSDGVITTDVRLQHVEAYSRPTGPPERIKPSRRNAADSMISLHPERLGGCVRFATCE